MYRVSVESIGGMVFLGVLFGVGILMVLAAIKFARQEKSDRKSKKAVLELGIMVAVALLTVGLYVAMRFLNVVEIEDGSLKAVFLTGFKSVEIAQVDMTDVYIIDWKADRQYAPARRIMGTSIGSFREGRFTLSNGDRAYLLANGSRVLVVKTRDDIYFFGPDEFEEFVSDFETNIKKID
ncbi:PH domain-containing protein [Alkalibacter saccharofermentans]|uniref:PH domain-containing protein n=1 Tax=Alkalibacter saccharofermentans DSM 14828 TaxID=1120975 RepID=A0A1M4WVJ3_9FIRM|nr:PH domain-containing protein [Alkalibacter saccharofermentans]SHE85177.1 PH domain-containing protein [Alkalibacter saccharofermentans DSM 14828]